jgi:biopolymer transport protein ExbD
MKSNRRLRRMERAKRKPVILSLTSLMDVFTILVFFLLLNQSATVISEPPKDVKLPDSIVQAKPRPTVVIMVNQQQVLVQGDPVVSTPDVMTAKENYVEPLRARLSQIKSRVIGINTQTADASNEVTILAHKTVPFKVIKKIMSTCASAGYSKISLAVNEKTLVSAHP